VLKSIPLLDRARPIVGTWSLSISATPQYAHVTLHPLRDCGGDVSRGREWLLWHDSVSWTVRGERNELRVEFCDPIH
jgi:hypothetical protein